MKTKHINKKNIGLLCGSFLLAATLLAGCAQDDGNYDYLPDEEVSKIELNVDTTITKNPYFIYNLDPGQEVDYHLRVKYAYPERLQYRWFLLKTYYNTYRAEQIGNAMVYPPADTIYYEKDLKWTCDLEPGTYFLYCKATDPTNGMTGYWQTTQYITVSSPGTQGGLYLLTERDGQTDIEVFTSDLMLIYSGLACHYKYYSSAMGHYLEGKPRFIKGTHTGKASKNGYLVATDKNLYRLNATGLTTMNTWDNIFYNTPATFNPQTSFYTNSCDFLLNDGKLYVTYANQTNDCKFSEPIAGDYEAFPFLMRNTYTTWRPVTGAINAWQVLYDQKNKKFRPYFSGGVSMSNFKSTVAEAVVDANSVPGDVKAVFQGGGNYTCVITVIGGKPYLYRYCFYNVVDDGDLSAEGERSIIDLSGCEDIMNAKKFCSNTAGYAFYYYTDKGVYSFSASSGETVSHQVYACEAGEEVTSIYIYGSAGGGWPTSNCILWIGVWNNSTQDGKLVQFEMDVNYGVPTSMWGPMFGAPDNPLITTGWGKIVDMTNIDAE